MQTNRRQINRKNKHNAIRKREKIAMCVLFILYILIEFEWVGSWNHYDGIALIIFMEGMIETA